MTTRHTFVMVDAFTDQLNGTPHETKVSMAFQTDNLDILVNEFRNYLWHCGYTYVDEVEVKKR